MKRASDGFTLLEVLLATAIMAVGTTSVLVVIATAAGMASQRQANVRREQVMDEARHDAQAIVDSFRPGAPAPTQVIGSRKGGTKTEPAGNTTPGKVEGKKSTRFDAFTYDLDFTAKDRQVPEKGYDVTITVHYGGGELSATTTTSMVSTTIPDDEFTVSSSYLEEQKGLGKDTKTQGGKR